MTETTEKAQQYCKVLRRYDRSPKLDIRFSGYDITLKSVPFEIDGVTALTLFFPVGKENAALRATKLGWIDETELYEKRVLGKTVEQDSSDIKEMSWHQLRKHAAKLGLDLTGKREDIESRILEVRRG